MPNLAPDGSTEDQSSSLFADVVPAGQRRLMGRKLRKTCPRTEQAKWEPVANRHNIIDLLKSQESYRREKLVPLRYERMAASPFAFLRGSALIMADDFSHLPHSTLTVQCCGDCHLANFGLFATPERNIIFDLNDFDETHPGPWEWDLKRLAVSFAVAIVDKGLSEAAARRCTATLVRTYRESMAMFAGMKTLDIWYYKFRFDDLIKGFKKPENRQLARERLEKLKKKRSHMGALEKLTGLVDGRRRIKDDPPLIEHPDTVTAAYVKHILDNYMQTLAPARQALLKRYRFVDAAFKVVGVGSVGTRAGILLLQGESDGDDPVFLQMKQATSSVLEPYTRPCRFAHQGQRVVVGQTLLQAASDTFLGWATGPGGVHYYLRQFMDVKVSMPLEELHEEGMHNYARSCAVTLARAHARSGDPAKLSGYMGNSETLDEAITDFAIKYMKQNELDYQTFLKALTKGELEAAPAH